MSFIIKGIDLPKNNPRTILLTTDGMAYIRESIEYVGHEAIQIPKGVRLIDANALFKDLREQQIPFNNDINSAINVAPTILESEE